jgi:pimeloyl-ACP methyl ester carboxylesterase
MSTPTYFRQDYLVTPDGAPVWFEVQSDGDPAAVLCDGLGCAGFIWKYLKPLLAQQRRVLHWNYRGHGRSGVPRDERRIGVPQTMDDLLRLLDAAGIEKAVMFGHSMGVQIAIEAHRLYPDRVSGLVLLCGSYGTPLDTWHDHTLLRVAFPTMHRLVEKAPGLARKITANLLPTELGMYFSMKTELNPDLLSKDDFWPYLEHLGQMDPVMFVRTLDSLKDHSVWNHLPKVNVPALVVGGEIDRFTPVWLSHRMADFIPGSEYLFVPGGSHTAPLERPGLVNRAIVEFLRQRVDPKKVAA